MRVALYSRVSKRDKQVVENQLDILRGWCAEAGHVIAGEYVDRISGKHGTEKRHDLARLMADAQAGRFALVCFWALDRFSREGMVATIGHLQRLAGYGVLFRSHVEPALNSDNELVRDILLGVLSALSRQERVRISERTKAGLERVRRVGSRSGKPIGRPGLALDKVRLIRSMAGQDKHVIAKAAGVHWKTVIKYAA